MIIGIEDVTKLQIFDGYSPSGSPTYGQNYGGNIPSLANTDLYYFDIHDNSRLGGTLSSLDSNVNLTYFDIHRTRITGSIPSLNMLTNLTHFDCHKTIWGYQMTGQIPSLDNNTNLIYFDIKKNNFDGNIPSIANNTSLVHFDCSITLLVGAVPDMTNNNQIEYFNCSYTDVDTFNYINPNIRHLLCDSIDISSFPPIDHLVNLKTWRSHLCQLLLSGTMPSLDNNVNLVIYHIGHTMSIGGTALKIGGPISSLSNNVNLEFFS